MKSGTPSLLKNERNNFVILEQSILDTIFLSSSLIELLVFIFFIYHFLKKSANVCSAYFYLLSLGYFVNLCCFISYIFDYFFTKNTIKQNSINIKEFEYVNRILQWYMMIFIGPLNAILSFNRFTSLLAWKKHKIIWSSKLFKFFLISLILYPIALNGFSFYELGCRLEPFTFECKEFLKRDFRITAISNASFAAISFLFGLITVSQYRTNCQGDNPLAVCQLKIDQKLLFQSIFSTFFFGAYCIMLFFFEPFFSNRNDPTVTASYILMEFFVNFCFMMGHYSSCVMIFVFSPKLRRNLFKFYRVNWLFYSKRRARVHIVDYNYNAI